MGDGYGKYAVLAALFMFAVLAVSAFAAPSVGMAAIKEKIANRAGIGSDKAQNAGHAEDPHYLEARATHLACRIDFATSVIDSVVAAVPQANDGLSGYSTKLKDDAAQLESLAAAGDKGAFDSFVSGTVKKDTADAIKALATERKSYKSYNITNETITSLREEYKSAQDAMKECEKGSVVDVGAARIRQYNAVIAEWQSSADKLGEKGVSTTAMQGVIDGAKSSVIAPLQSAVGSGDSEQVKAALKTYCLGNGCPGYGDAALHNYHGFAKINLERLQAIKDKLAANATSDSGKLSEAQAKLDIVRSTLAQVDGNQYSEEQQNAVWNNLREAANLIRGHMKEGKPRAGASSTAGREAPPAVPGEASQ